MNEISEFRKEIMEAIKGLHDKQDSSALKVALLQSTTDGINRRLDILNGSVAKHSDALSELQKTDIRNEAIVSESNRSMDALKARLDTDGKVIVDLQDQIEGYPLIKKAVFFLVGVGITAIMYKIVDFLLQSKQP